MGRPSVQVEYLAIGANRHTAASDWGPDGIVCFGAGVNLALWRPADSSSPATGISGLLSGHQDVVKAVKFLPSLPPIVSYVVSGGDDHCLKLWSIPKGETNERAECLQTAQEHTAPVNCLAVPDLSRSQADRGGSILFASGAADATIRLWFFEEGQIRLAQSIKTNPKFFPLSLALVPLNTEGTAYMLAAAGTRDTIQIFVASDVSQQGCDFKLQATLSGHEGWIRSLDFTWETDSPDSDVMLASASQDKYIRLWRVHAGQSLPAQAAAVAPMDAGSTMGAFLPGRSPSNKAHRVSAAGADFTVTFEALILAHDDWIYSARWYRSASGAGRPRLLSTSADNSLAIWEADAASGIWVSTARLGELSKEKGATTATGSIGGFWTGLWSPSGAEVITLGRTGSWRRWEYDPGADRWVQALAVSGHTKAVTGVSWARDGGYLLSTSADQTTRLHAEWKTRNAGGKTAATWHEMARPQIHGYDLNCVATLGESQFVSGADEKLMRVFSEPKAVARLLARLTGASEPSASSLEAMPDAANMPLLGLSNKAVDAAEENDVNAGEGQLAAAAAAAAVVAAAPAEGEDAADPAPAAHRPATLDLDRPPLEDALSRHTLWPEAEKLYGHGYEISCLAASPDGRLVASACRASSLNHAVVRLFETARWTEVRPPLAAHSLTATRLRFSPPDGALLLSVGRDRQWAVFERGGEGEDKGEDKGEAALAYRLRQANPKGHARMILDCAWAPAENGGSITTTAARRVFATAGRDKSIKIWAEKTDIDGKSDDTTTDKPPFELATTIAEEHPVTAVDFLWRRTRDTAGSLALAAGTEAGRLSVRFLSPVDLSVTSTLALDPDLCLPKAVLQLAWRPPGKAEEGDSGAELAIAGEDGSLRIYRFEGI